MAPRAPPHKKRAPRRKAPAYKKRAPRRAGRRPGRKAPARLSPRVKNVAGQLSFSGCTHAHRSNKTVAMMERVGAPNNIVNQVSAILSSTSGQQFSSSFSMFDTTQLLQLLTSIVTSNPPRRMVVEGLRNEYTLTNFTNAPIEVEIYDIVPIRDIYNNYSFTSTTVAGAYNYPVYPAPEAYWQEGLNAQSQAVPATTNQYLIGTQPTDSVLFRDFFKIKRKTVVMLPITGVHRHLVNIRTNRLIDNYLVGNGGGADNSVRGLKGFTSYVLFNIRGLPVWGTGAGGTPPAGTTSSAAQVGIVGVQRIKTTYVSDLTYSSVLSQGLQIPGSGNTNAWNWGSGAQNALSGLASLP